MYTTLDGKVKGYKRKWDKPKTDAVSKWLFEANEHMPSDTHRCLRDLNDLAKWKGTEFRTFLMYVGMVALRPVLSNNEYEHFLVLVFACTIVSSNVYRNYISVAEEMFKRYVETYIQLYGRHSITSNLHNLIHIIDDLNQNGLNSIDKMSTYKYENSLRLLGMKLQTCNRPLEQISRRLIEISQMKTDLLGNANHLTEPEFSPHVQYELSANANCYSKITIAPDVVLSRKNVGDQWFLTRTGIIVKMVHAQRVQNSFVIWGFSMNSTMNFFSRPLESNQLNIFQSDSNSISTTLTMHEINLIAAKMICLPFADKLIFIPILHTLEILS